MEQQNVISLENVSLSYDGGKTHVMKNVDLKIDKDPNQSKIVALIGASGCGKSTALRFIGNLQNPTSGRIKVADKYIENELDSYSAGMIFQKYSSMEWFSVYKNVELGLLNVPNLTKEEKHKKIINALNLVDLTEHKDRFAQYPLLSGGQLQRVAIARSLISDPQILLMDEPFGALDVNTRLKMQELILDICSKMNITVILVTHDIKEATYLAEEILIMEAGTGKIKQKIKVPFSKSQRTRHLLRTTQFTDLVYNIENIMLEEKSECNKISSETGLNNSGYKEKSS